MIRTVTACAALLLLICLACNQKTESVEQLNSAALTAAGIAADSTFLPQQEPEQKPKNGNDKIVQKTQPVDWDKKIIKTADLNAEVKEYKSFSAQVSDKVKKYGGYISQENQSETAYKIENSIVVKVPVDQFENAVSDLLNGAEKINEKRISSDDITEQLIDGKSRLEAKRQVRLRYLELLKQAKNMEEILTVQKEINEIQEEIEAVTGRLNYLGHSAAMSTINFSFYQVLDATAKDPDNAGFLTKVKSAFTSGLFWMGEVLVGLVGLWPLLLLLVIVVYFFKKRRLVKSK